mgnify:CR=1 FL=1
MNAKLTISLDKEIIRDAKAYAKLHGVSLSKMIESYFASIVSVESDDARTGITPLVKSLGNLVDLPDDYDYKRSRAEYLSEKYQ